MGSVAPMTREEEIKLEFKKIKQTLDDPEIVSKCIVLCSKFGISPSSLARKWESHIINNKLDSKASLTSQEMEKFASTLQISQPQYKPDVAVATKVYSKNNIKDLQGMFSTFGADDMDVQELEEIEVKEPVQQVQEWGSWVDSAPVAPMTPMSDEMTNTWVSSNIAKVEETFNPNPLFKRDFEVGDDPLEGTLEINLDHSQTRFYRYMNDKIPEMASALESRLEILSQAILEREAIGEPGIAHVPQQDTIIAIGRVCCEEEGKLNATSVMLETLFSHSKMRVKLLLKDVEKFSLFPGQIIAMSGVNPSGKLFIVSKIYSSAPLPMLQSPISHPAPFSVVIASGPWTTSENFLFNPLDDFLNQMDNDTPDLIVMLGPFVDVQHPLVDSGKMTEAFDDVLARSLKKIEEKVEDMENTKVLLLPSLRDANHDYVFPQAPYPIKDLPQLKKSDKIEYLPNPCSFTFNGVSFSISSNDIIKHLAASETSKNPGASDRMSTLCGHILDQRSLYPLFPSVSSPNDYSHMKQTVLPFTPDVLVLPSDLKHFIKNVQNVLAINPGRLTLGKSAGTYARFTIHPKASGQHVVDRTYAEILRL